MIKVVYEGAKECGEKVLVTAFCFFPTIFSKGQFLTIEKTSDCLVKSFYTLPHNPDFL